MRNIPWVLYALAALAAGCASHESPSAVKPSPRSSESPNTEVPAPMTTKWPFAEAKNSAVITLKRILDGSKPILYVLHDVDGDWQFLDGGDVTEADENVVNLDASLHSLADLPVGWSAERTAVDQPWQRFQ